MFKLVKGVPVGLVMAVIASTGVIYAASNANTASRAGKGSGSISGFIVSGVVYRQSVDPGFVAAVEFDLDQAAGTVQVKLVSSDSHYTACQNTGGVHWECPLRAAIPLRTWMICASWRWETEG